MPLADTEMQLLMSALDSLRQDMGGIRSDISLIASKLDNLTSDANGRLSTLEEKVRVAELAIAELRVQAQTQQATGPSSVAWWIRTGAAAKQIIIWLAIAGAVLHYLIPAGVAKALLGATQIQP